MAPLAGERFCFTHSAAAASHRRAARVQGGKATRTAKAKGPVPVATLAELQAHVGQVLADVFLLPNSSHRAMAAARLIMDAARLVEASETRLLLESLRHDVERLTQEAAR